MTQLSHEFIQASAGTGKTYQLTNRYLRLLFLTHEPEKIIALTFTRKAAGEFFEKIFRRLAEGAEDSAKASRLGTELGIKLSPELCHAQLRLLLERLHRLQLSTYDSFFTRIVQTFPFELGLAAAPSLLDEEQRMHAIERAQQALSRRTQTEQQFLTDFWHACKRATMGAETKNITDIVTEFILRNHSLFFDATSSDRWGREATIWGEVCPWRSAEVDLTKEAKILQETLDWPSIAPTQTSYWRELIEDLKTWRPPLELPRRIKYFLPKLLEQYDQLDSGACVLDLNRKRQTLTPELGASLKRVAQSVFWSVVEPKLEATQGIYDLVRLFEEIYSQEIRLMGQLTLEDATRLLSGSPTHGRGLADPELREILGYRLDGAFDHWLLDEFQDTSRNQWQAISDMIDEILQDPESRRTFFAVGDTKQSLYGWRGSDDRLFDRIFQRYRSVISIRSLNESYRSSPSVLAMVNTVLGNDVVIGELFSAELAQRWKSIWQNHVSAKPIENKLGFSCLIHADETDEAGFATILDLLQELQPLEKGLSVAILTQQNESAHELVEFLRTNAGPPCSLAANVAPGVDNVVAAGLRSLLTLAAHPDDTVAWQHLRMTPVRPEIENQFPTSAQLSEHLLKIWSDYGLVGIVDEWMKLCGPFLDTADTFNRGRLELCRNAAVVAEERGENDIDLFIRQLNSLSLREHDTPGQVAVMTIHKAKGLDWDIVIVTDLDGKTLMERRRGLEVHRSAQGDIEWVLDMPESEVAKHDPALAARIKASKEDAAFEKLCVLYVGLTRAKSGLYVVTHRAKGTSANYHRLLDETLMNEETPLKIGAKEFTCAWREGDMNWLNAARPERRKMPPEHTLEPITAAEYTRRTRPIPLQPSSEKLAHVRGNALLARDKTQRELGNLLHHALSQVEWLEAPSPPNAPGIQEASTELNAEAQALFDAILSDQACRTLFERPPGSSAVWREMPFEVLLDSRWISGRFDRVVIQKNPAGHPVSATIVDLKLHQIRLDDLVLKERHEAQMKVYQAVAAQLLGLKLDRVNKTLLVVQTDQTTPPRVISL